MKAKGSPGSRYQINGFPVDTEATSNINPAGIGVNLRFSLIE
jgi:hypothetical protein